MTESPIEEKLLAEFIDQPHRFHVVDVNRVSLGEAVELWGHVKQKIVVVPQVKIGRHRVDFLLMDNVAAPRQFVAVECDGHQFHHANEWQELRDSMRDDRILHYGNVRTIRLTGKQINKDTTECAMACVVELLNGGKEYEANAARMSGGK